MSDGVFTASPTWNNLEEFSFLTSELPMLHFEVHLMAVNPEQAIEGWLKNGAERVIVHLEAMSNPHLILEKVKEADGEVMLAINPGTSADGLLPYLNSFSAFQILAVPPGPSNQKFDERALEKIKFLRERAPNAIIEVDGGINPETAKLAKEARANILVSTSYIMDSPDPASAFQRLEAA